MITYFAAPSLTKEIDWLVDEGVTHTLVAFNVPAFEKLYRYAVSKGLHVMVDSGAYNAYTHGITMDVAVYGNKMLELGAEIFINLDVIGNDVATMENQKYLESLGLHPIPVWHHGSGYERLGELVQGHEYIALGGIVSSNMRVDKKRTLINYITELHPNTRFHGLGIGPGEYDGLYSCDSTTWVVGGKHKRIITKKGSVDILGNYFTKEELYRHNIRALLDITGMELKHKLTDMDEWMNQ